MHIRELPALVRDTVRQYVADNAARLSAALAFYTTFSLAPLLIIAIAVAGMAVGEEAARGMVTQQLAGLLGRDGAGLVEDMLVSARRPEAGTTAMLVGLGVLLFGASNVFAQLQLALNAIWGVKPEGTPGVWDIVRSRLLSFGLVLGTGFVLLVSLFVNAALAGFYRYLEGVLPSVTALWPVATAVCSLLIIALLFALLFKYLPDTRIAWRDVAIGATVTAVLFQLGQYLLGLYLGQGTFSSTYGAAGSVLVLLFWVYYASQILFLGAEFTQVYAFRHGSRRGERESDEPAAHALGPEARNDQPPSRHGARRPGSAELPLRSADG